MSAHGAIAPEFLKWKPVGQCNTGGFRVVDYLMVLGEPWVRSFMSQHAFLTLSLLILFHILFSNACHEAGR